MNAAETIPLEAEFLTYAQAAVVVQVHPATIRQWCRQGRLRRYGEGRFPRVRKAELIAFMEGLSSQPKRFDPDARAAALLARIGR